LRRKENEREGERGEARRIKIKKQKVFLYFRFSKVLEKKRE
jgi:hypothetical protein